MDRQVTDSDVSSTREMDRQRSQDRQQLEGGRRTCDYHDRIVIADVAAPMRDIAGVVDRVSRAEDVALISNPRFHLALQNDTTLLTLVDERGIARVSTWRHHDPRHLDLPLKVRRQ